MGDERKRVIGHSNSVVTKYKTLSSDQKKIVLEDKIVKISDILNTEVPDIPLETNYSVAWFVVNGRQIAFKPECGEGV